MKYIFDLTLGIAIVIFTLPFMILIFLFILILQGPPVFFKQLRPGLNGKPFIVYKFCTMTNKCDMNNTLLPDFDRRTGLGNFLRSSSFDELPEIFNVIKGDISLVGPRPLLMQYLSRYTPEQARRHEVKPGITGWAQVNGRNAISWEEKFALDVWYVDHRSFWLDLKIIFMSIWKVLKREGINQSEQITMKEFTGYSVDSERTPK
jgi:sugar transferase EpsL